LIVGLGNPGAEYEETRHNAGFWWIDAIAQAFRLNLKAEAKFKGVVGRLSQGGDVWLLKPNTYMNLSGQAVGALAQFYKIEAKEILVVHDELDLEPGVAKLKWAGGHAGHNGLKDIAAHLGTPEFWRLRIGIGHPGDRSLVKDYVLHRPGREEFQRIETSLDDALRILPELLKGDMEAAMLKLHTRH
jgi:PTH1 family peptidyl-tRNA hydrolase